MTHATFVPYFFCQLHTYALISPLFYRYLTFENGKDYDRLYRMDIRGEVPRTRVKYQSKVLELRYKISGLQILRLSTLSPGPVCLRNNSVRSKTHWLHRGY